MASPSGDPRGPWSPPRGVRGMENSVDPRRRGGPYGWSCASGNPGPAFHPNGTLFAAMRQNPCFRGRRTAEHVGIWRADAGWESEWRIVTEQPVYGWGGGGPRNCTDAAACPSHEDPVGAGTRQALVGD